MTNRTLTQIDGDEDAGFVRAEREFAPSSHRPAAEGAGTVILLRRAPSRLVGSAWAASPDLPESLGEVALRLVAQWSRPSCKMLPSDVEEDSRPAAPPDQLGEEPISGA